MASSKNFYILLTPFEVRIVNNELGSISFYFGFILFFLDFIFGFILLFFILDLDERCDIMSCVTVTQVTKRDEVVTGVTG